MDLDLNCDLGEGEPWERTRALIGVVDSINIACGVHAGSVALMERCIRLAIPRNVKIGAHPGLPGNFGRKAAAIDPEELILLLLQQVGGFEHIAHRAGTALHHVKLHGALYHMTDADPGLAAAYLKSMARWFPGVRVYVRAGGLVAGMARRFRVPASEEGFADRTYRSDGTLVERTHPKALVKDVARVVQRVERYLETGKIPVLDGPEISLQFETLCVHGDSVKAVELAKAVARVLRQRRLT
jgi:UPF0271 protein